jgi:hypothetical protein
MMKRLMLAGVAAALLGAGACQDTTGPEVQDDQLLLQAALVAADATLEDLGIAGGPFSFGILGSGGQNGHGPGMGPGQPGGQRGLGGSWSGTRDVSFYDAAGNVQDVYDALTTERIEASVDIEGETARSNWTASIDRTRDMVITGLAGENTTRIVNGSGTEVVSRSALLSDGETATRDMTGTFTYNDLVIPTPDQEVRYPLSGTITRQMTIVVVNGRNGDIDKTVNVTITFDGDETATGVVDGETFEIDLTAREGGFPLGRGPGRRSGG